MKNQLWENSACEIVDALRGKEIKPSEVLDSIKSRCDEVNNIINAIPTLCFGNAYKNCLKAEKNLMPFNPPFYGLPIPIKDSYNVKGVKTTYGSLAFKDFIPNNSDLLVIQIESSGGVIYGKTNTPEFEAGASTFNEVFGRTLNPWNLNLSVAGSSGGAAASVASGMAFISQGSDFACSLRYPASFCGIVGLRTTPGLIPQGPGKLPYQTLSVIGPLGRNVEDVSLALDGMCGYNSLDPLTSPMPKINYRLRSKEINKPHLIAYSSNLKITKVSKKVEKITSRAINSLNSHGIRVEKSEPDLSYCHESFHKLRAFQFSSIWGDVLKKYRDVLKPEVVWNIEEGFKLQNYDLSKAEKLRSIVRENLLKFLDKYEFLITPTAPVPPNPVEERFVKNIDGMEMESYLDWLALGYAVSVTGCPAISIPCGFTNDNIPIGIQIIGKPYSEASLLSFAKFLENIFNVNLQKPLNPNEKS